jgi:hypothetical protein
VNLVAGKAPIDVHNPLEKSSGARQATSVHNVFLTHASRARIYYPQCFPHACKWSTHILSTMFSSRNLVLSKVVHLHAMTSHMQSGLSHNIWGLV